jgi:hypothetical protein
MGSLLPLNRRTLAADDRVSEHETTIAPIEKIPPPVAVVKVSSPLAP